MELTLLSINTWKCDGDYFNRRKILKEELKKMGARVILCQECFRSADGSVDTLDDLAQALGMSAYAVPARKKQRLLGSEWVDSYSGLGVLTALPVLDHLAIDLPSTTADAGRKAQLLTIEMAPGQKLLIANIHLTHLPDEELRRRQLKTIVDAMQDSKAAFRILGGDWNAEAQNLGSFREITRAADCYVLGQGDEPRCSLLACYKKGLSICVDHFYTLPPYPSFIRAGMVLDRPDAGSGLYPSDHFGIRVTLTY